MNVSPREMVQVPVDEIVLERLRALGLPPAMLEIEITEETALDIEAVQGKLLALSRAGIGVALDDFGIGYSSLASLRHLRAGRVKIDRSLVTGLADSDDKRGLVQAVLGLGRALGLEVVAEGVETAEDLAMLRSLGCPFVQGYHLGRPPPGRGAPPCPGLPAAGRGLTPPAAGDPGGRHMDPDDPASSALPRRGRSA